MSGDLWENTTVGTSHVDEIHEIVYEEDNEQNKMRIELEIENFDSLSETELINVIEYTMVGLGDNIEITSIQRKEGSRVLIELRFNDFDENEYLRNYYQDQYNAVGRVAQQLKFPNCGAIDKLFGKSETLKKGDKRIDEEKCNICFCEYKEKEKIRELPECGHSSHKKCLDRWLKKKAQCPMCRHNVLENKLRTSIIKIAEQHGVYIQN